MHLAAAAVIVPVRLAMGRHRRVAAVGVLMHRESGSVHAGGIGARSRPDRARSRANAAMSITTERIRGIDPG